MDRRFFLAMCGLGAASFGFSTSLGMAATNDGTLIWGSSMSPSLDPHAQLDNPSMFIRTNVYDSLYVYDGDEGDLTPWLIASSELSGDGFVYDFVLRDDALFHDGTQVTAADAVFSMKRVIKLGRHLKSVFGSIYDPNEVEQTGDLSFRVKLLKPYGAFPDSLTLLAIVNKKLVEENAGGDNGFTWLSGNDAGSGAYQIVEGSYRPQESLDLVRFDEHFDPGTIGDRHDHPLSEPRTDGAAGKQRRGRSSAKCAAAHLHDQHEQRSGALRQREFP